MDDTPASVLVGLNFPTSTDPQTDKQFKLGSLKLAETLFAAFNEHLCKSQGTGAGPPSADMIGAACYLVAHAVASAFDDERKQQIMDALLGMAAINLPNDTTKH